MSGHERGAGTRAGRTPKPAYHPRSHAQRQRGGRLLGLREASAMAIGGMIGGGIFSVLGVTIDLAGHLAFAAFLLGGLIAALTAHAYARLALHAGRAGGPFTYLREEGHTRAAAWVAWLLIVGYVFALAVYAFTFGHYLAHVLGGSALVARACGIGILALFVAINLRGVTTSGLTEDVVVFTKLAVLGGIAAIGIGMFSPSRLSPLDNQGLLGVFLGAAVIFVAYEGFELVPYDYDDISEPRRTVPRALYISVAVVAIVYIAVTLASQMLLADGTIVAQKEVAFAVVGQKALGDFGLWAATVGAVFSTSSAINATLFSTARLVHDVSAADELPTRLSRERRGLPASAVIWLALLGAVFSLLPGITEIVSFGSLTFLLVFGLINLMHARHTANPGWDRRLAFLGGVACFAATAGLLYYLARSDRAGLALIGVCAAAIAIARAVFLSSRRKAGSTRTTDDSIAPRGLRGWWTYPPRAGMRLMIAPCEYRHLRAWACLRIVSGAVLAALGVLTLAFGGTNWKTYGWTMVFVALAAANWAFAWWELSIARSEASED